MQKVILYSLKQVLHLQTSGIRESTTLSRCDFSIFTGSYNEIIFNIKNNDNINITSFPTLYLYVIKDNEVLVKYSMIKRGHSYILVNPQMALPIGIYNYAVTTDTGAPVYTDQNFTMRGYFQIKHGVDASGWSSFDTNLEYAISDELPILLGRQIKAPFSITGGMTITTIAPVDGSLIIYGSLSQNTPSNNNGWAKIYEMYCMKNLVACCEITAKLELISFKFIPTIASSISGENTMIVKTF